MGLVVNGMKSIFTDDLNTCCVTGQKGHVERHHVFGASNRTRSTFYGFIAPLLAPIHPNGAFGDDKESKRLIGMTTKELDIKLKQRCQEFYENELHKSREEFIQEFGKNYL